MFSNKLLLLSSVFAIISLVKLAKSSEEVYAKCGDDINCLEQEFVNYIDRMDNSPEVPLLGDLLVMQKTENELETARDGENLFERATRYLATHELKIKTSGTTARSLQEEARAKKLRRMILPILLLLKLKAAIVIPAVLSIIALVSFKGLGASLIALAISMATGLKSLLDSSSNHHANKLTYEIVPGVPGGPHWSRTDPLAQGYHTVP